MLSSVLFFACSDDSSSGASHIDEQETPTCVDDNCDLDSLSSSSNAKDSVEIKSSSSNTKDFVNVKPGSCTSKDTTEIKPEEKKDTCGTEIYNPEEKFCQDEILYELCGEESYDVKTEFYFGDSVYTMCGEVCIPRVQRWIVQGLFQKSIKLVVVMELLLECVRG